jgi:hypothetical protein
VRIIYTERFYSIYTCHRSNATPHRLPLSLYLHYFYTKEKRAKTPHLIDEFSLVLGFLGHIFCLFLDGEIVFYYSLFFTFYLFLVKEEKSVTKYSGNLKEK